MFGKGWKRTEKEHATSRELYNEYYICPKFVTQAVGYSSNIHGDTVDSFMRHCINIFLMMLTKVCKFAILGNFAKLVKWVEFYLPTADVIRQCRKLSATSDEDFRTQDIFDNVISI